VRAGSTIAVSGTTAVDALDQGPYEQARRCFEIIEKALHELGAGLHHVVRTRMFVTDISLWEKFGQAHREFFGANPPATTMVEVKALIDPRMLIEVEADAIVV
jgi:isochorismate pyruvate lyase